MDADAVPFRKTLPHGIDIVHPAERSFQCIDAPFRCQPRMSAFPDEPDTFMDHTVPAVSCPCMRFRILAHDMTAQDHIHIVKFTKVNELLLTADKMQFSLFDQTVPVRGFDHFFSRNTDESKISVKFFHQSAADQSETYTDDRSELGIMTASVIRTRNRIAAGM